MNFPDQLEKIFYNHLAWAGACRDGDSRFPYIPVEKKGVANIDKTPAENFAVSGTSDFPYEGRDKIGFLLNIPLLLTDANRCTDILKMISQEGFGDGKKTLVSPLAASSRVSVVIGLNKKRSLDEPQNNEAFKGLTKLERVAGLNYKILPFFWVPHWSLRQGLNAQLMYSKEKSFKLFKMLNPELARKWLKEVEGGAAVSKQLNFQRIRETIKTSDFTRVFFQQMRRSPLPLYFVVMDGDMLSMRAEKMGLFSIADQRMGEYLKGKGKLPSVFSPGYFASKNEAPLTRLAVRLDMGVRAAMAQAIPQAPYYPEPITFFLTRTFNEFGKLTFFGGGTTLETRRLTQSGVHFKVLDPKDMLFTADPALATTIPDRMKPTHADELDKLSRDKIGQQKYLKALRGIGQTHISPKEWADEVYGALPISCSRVTDLTTPMMYLFKIFDPIDVARRIPPVLDARYHQKYFTQTLDHFPDYVAFLGEGADKLEPLVSKFASEDTEKEKYRTFFSQIRSELIEGLKKIKALGLSEEWVARVHLAAKGSGVAMHRVFIEQLIK